MHEFSDDSLIVDAVLAGEKDRFGTLITRYRDRIYRFILKQIGSLVDSEDLTQDTFVEAYVCLSSFKRTAKFSTWLYGIALNISRNYITRCKSIRYKFLPEDVLLKRPCALTSPLAHSEISETMRILIRAIDTLPPEQREVLVLVTLEELSYEETAQIAGIPLGTVKSRMYQARKRLKEVLKKKGFAI